MSTSELISAGRSLPDALLRSRHTVDPALRAAVDSLPVSLRRVARYHFGWADEHGEPANGDGGKAVRPALVLLAAEAVGGDPVSAVPAAVAVELVHNFSLLHDDVMDGDVLRRHRPTAWRVFGLNSAVLVGDALLNLAFEVLAGSGHLAAMDGIRTLSAAVLGLLDGQSADLAFETRARVGLTECVSMVQGKTAGLLGCSCALGAMFGGGRPEQVSHLRGFGEDVGLAFQHVDDLLGIWGDPAVTGKPVYSDLRNRKKSLPVVAALASDTAEGRELAQLYGREGQLSEAELSHLANLVEVAGGRAWSQAEANSLLAEALLRLEAARPTPGAATQLEALARLATRRDH